MASASAAAGIPSELEALRTQVLELQQALVDTQGVSYVGWIAEIRRMAENEKELSKTVKDLETRLGAGGSKLDSVLSQASTELDALKVNSTQQAQQFQGLYQKQETTGKELVDQVSGTKAAYDKLVQDAKEKFDKLEKDNQNTVQVANTKFQEVDAKLQYLNQVFGSMQRMQQTDVNSGCNWHSRPCRLSHQDCPRYRWPGASLSPSVMPSPTWRNVQDKTKADSKSGPGNSGWPSPRSGRWNGQTF